jgi:hypothetical protein
VEGQKGAPRQELARRLAAEAAECDDAGRRHGRLHRRGCRPEAAERAIRAGLLRLGAEVLEDLLATDRGYAGPRAECGDGHQAAFAGYWDKSTDTVLGPVAIRRAWYPGSIRLKRRSRRWDGWGVHELNPKRTGGRMAG